jgi:hypothetical protein
LSTSTGPSRQTRWLTDERTPGDEFAQDARPFVEGRRLALDAITLAVLGGVALVARWGSLPTDGLWFDDSWVGAGAILAGPGELLTVGSSHPGFTAILMTVDRFSGNGVTHLGVPSLAFGVVAPMVLYLGLRSFGYGRPIAAILGAALAVAPIPVLYAGRVKGYTLDTLVVLLIAVVIPSLARRTWRWPLAAAWTVVAVVVGTFSGYALVATVGAGLILALHPSGDRAMRMAAVGIQAAVQGVYLVALQSKSDTGGVEHVLETLYDGHLRFSWNPLAFGPELLEHVRRLAEVYPASPESARWWLTLLAALSLSGLVIAATAGRRRSETLAGRYLLLLVVVAAAASLMDRFPFGPNNESALSPGGRHTLWMVPALAFGLAVVAHRIRGWIALRGRLWLGFDALIVVAAVAIIVLGYDPAPQAPFPGSESAARFVDASLRGDDVAIVTTGSVFSFAMSTETPVGVKETPNRQVGFAPVYLDPRIESVGEWAATPGSPAEMRDWTAHAERVLVLSAGALAGPGREGVRATLESAGFELLETEAFAWNTVDIYRK